MEASTHRTIMVVLTLIQIVIAIYVGITANKINQTYTEIKTINSDITSINNNNTTNIYNQEQKKEFDTLIVNDVAYLNKICLNKECSYSLDKTGLILNGTTIS